jgi:hypothetical protein
LFAEHILVLMPRSFNLLTACRRGASIKLIKLSSLLTRISEERERGAMSEIGLSRITHRYLGLYYRYSMFVHRYKFTEIATADRPLLRIVKKIEGLSYIPHEFF